MSPRTHNLQSSSSIFYFIPRGKANKKIPFCLWWWYTILKLPFSASQFLVQCLIPTKVKNLTTFVEKNGDENWYLFLWLYKLFAFCQSWGCKEGRGWKTRWVEKFTNCENLLRLRFFKKLQLILLERTVLKLMLKAWSI